MQRARTGRYERIRRLVRVPLRPGQIQSAPGDRKMVEVVLDHRWIRFRKLQPKVPSNPLERPTRLGRIQRKTYRLRIRDRLHPPIKRRRRRRSQHAIAREEFHVDLNPGRFRLSRPLHEPLPYRWIVEDHDSHLRPSGQAQAPACHHQASPASLSKLDSDRTAELPSAGSSWFPDPPPRADGSRTTSSCCEPRRPWP